MTRSLALLPLLALVACAHTQPLPPPIVITGQTLDWAGATFEVVDAGMRAANKAHALTDAQVVSYEEFVARWSAGYRLAAKQWAEARTKLDQPAVQQAVGILTGLLSELAQWQFVMMGATR
jgi:hypothetical protein